MSQEPSPALQRSLEAIDRYRKRVSAAGWIVVVATLGLYARLAYLHRTTDDLERLLGASVTALTFLIAWVAFAIVLVVLRSTKSILRAIELSSRKD
jgi:hypothetical protein